jgi:hypothetical protein
MVWVQDKGMIPAIDVAVGDILSNGRVVAKVGLVQRRGAYAPFTETGTIMVSGCVASNYVTFLTSSTSPMNQHDMAHALFSYRRARCRLLSCHDEEYDEVTGFALWLVPVYTLVLFLRTLPNLVQFSLAVASVPFLGAATFIEQVVRLSWPLTLLLLVVSRFGFTRICKIGSSDQKTMKVL